MCGIVGFIDTRASKQSLAQAIERMADTIRHRGPDSNGHLVEDALALGFRRLAILDLSPAGNQPMASHSGRYVIAFNGEIYNHHEIRRELSPAINWRGHSDTETLTAAIDAYGVEATLKKLNGMFAIAVWDRDTKNLWLARDRLGEKPLYYGWSNDIFLFGSELKALIAHPRFQKHINRQAVSLFLRYGYVPAPHSIWQDIFKLPPGHYLKMGPHDRDAKPASYWNLIECTRQAPLHDNPERLQELDALLHDAVRLRMESDVPMGVFLSGGIDSSIVTAMMQQQSRTPVRSFSIGFENGVMDEAPFAKAVARHLGTDHTELYIKPDDMLAVIADLPRVWDEPFADPSQIPTLILARLARQHVTVALTGDGGDELFYGYGRYFNTRRYRMLSRCIPRLLRAPVGNGIASFVTGYGRLSRSAEMLKTSSERELYQLVMSIWDPRVLMPDVEDHDAFLALPDFGGPDNNMMGVDALTFLPDDILVKVDRASMAASLETRPPLLDHRLVEFAFRLPMSTKFHGGNGKYLLRQCLARYIPSNLIDRPKAGFSAPIAQWLRGPMHDWAASLLDPHQIKHDGLLQPTPIASAWHNFIAGESYQQYRLWPVLMLQTWLREQEAY